jgi:hypothetical protein
MRLKIRKLAAIAFPKCSWVKFELLDSTKNPGKTNCTYEKVQLLDKVKSGKTAGIPHL